MLEVYGFWIAASILFLLALCFIIPPIWLSPVTQFNLQQRLLYSSWLVVLAATFSIYVYAKLGTAHKLFAYYGTEQKSQRQSYKLIRPLYARIKHELIKDRMNIPIDLQQIDLILNFAQIQSQASQGTLQPEMQELLHAVLKAVPSQITALNLLAVNAYKTQQYMQAIEYWHNILQQFTPEMRNSALEKVLQDKIVATKTLAIQQRSQAS